MEATADRAKNIDVMTLAMIDLEHHSGAPAERPMINDGLSRINLPDERTGYSEQLRPTWLLARGAHAASG